MTVHNKSTEEMLPELVIGSLSCVRVDTGSMFSLKLSNTIDERVMIYEVQIYASLPEGDNGPEQTQNVGVELDVGGAYEGSFQAYKAAGLPDENLYYIDVIYEDEHGDSYVEQHSTDVSLTPDGELIASPPKFIEQYCL